MTMRRLEKANVFSFGVLLIFVIVQDHYTQRLACRAASTVSLWSGPTLLAVVRSVHGKVDLLTFAKELPCYVCLITLPA
jgi:hypothetical protein